MTVLMDGLASQCMAAWHSRRPTVAVMGEYSSGKSALLNCLLGQALLPTRVTATDLAPVWITSGPALRIYGLAPNGVLQPLTVEALTAAKSMNYVAIRVEMPARILDQIDIIDTPGISDPRMSSEIVERIASFSDFVVWCSPINQAWRQTELAFWRTMPERLKKHSILTLTRVDMMENPKDREKVIARCKTEASGLFSDVRPVSSALALASFGTPPGDQHNTMLLGSGLGPFLDRFQVSTDAATALCQSRPSLPDPTAQPDKRGVLVLGKTIKKAEPPAKTAVPEKMERAAKPEKPDQVEKPVTHSGKPPRPAKAALNTADLGTQVAVLRKRAKASSLNDHILDTIEHLFGQLNGQKQVANGLLEVLTLALDVPAGTELNFVRALKQIEEEVLDFIDGPWRKIGPDADR